MRRVTRRAVAAVVAASAWCSVGSGVVIAADLVVPGAPPSPQYYGEQEYYEEPPLQPGYVLRPLLPVPVYPYAPPIYRYGYGPPPVAVVPPPHYRPYRPGYRYGYVARGGHGPYGGGYRHHGRYR